MPYDRAPWKGELECGTKALCACGESANKPFCDGSHAREGTEKTPSVVEITEQKIREDLVVYHSFRERLKHLGVRSFSIRVQRRLEKKRLKAAQDDLVSTVRRVGDWLTLNGEPNLLTFLKGNWLMVLACAGVLIGGFLLVRFGRRGLDRVIRDTASKVPQLRAVAVTVHSEEAQAKRSQAQGEVAAKAAEEAALAEVSKEEAGKAQKMGEGGYGGGAS